MTRKSLGILVLLLAVMAGTALLDRNFLGAGNIQNVARWTGMYGLLSIGMAFVLITGGVDLSVGSIVGLVGSLLPMLVSRTGLPVPLALLVVLALAAAIGLVHGLLITRLKLQPFVVTLCGLFVYRGLARWLTNDVTQGLDAEGFSALSYLAKGFPFALPVPGIGSLQVPMPFLVMVVVGIAASVFLNRTIWGRHLLALGNNETAARYSGIRTDRMVVLAYVLSASAAGLAGVIFALDLGFVQPSGHGNFFELYAIAGAVLGGCSLRGGEGSIFGVILGTALVRVLYNAINILSIPTQLEFAVIGLVILVGVVADEVIRRVRARRFTRAGGPGG